MLIEWWRVGWKILKNPWKRECRLWSTQNYIILWLTAKHVNTCAFTPSTLVTGAPFYLITWFIKTGLGRLPPPQTIFLASFTLRTRTLDLILTLILNPSLTLTLDNLSALISNKCVSFTKPDTCNEVTIKKLCFFYLSEEKKVAYILLGDSWNYMPPILVSSSAKRIATQMLVTEKLNGRKDFVLSGFVCDIISPSKRLPVQS